MRHTIRLLTILALLAACTDDDEDGPLDVARVGIGGITRTTTVIIQGTTFFPTSILVPPGAIVTFVNTTTILHNVTFVSPTIVGIPDLTFGTRTVLMPDVSGRFVFFCSIHPAMTGVITVGF